MTLFIAKKYLQFFKNETKETDENSPNEKKQTKYISFDKPKQSLNFDEFDIQIDSYLSTIEGKSYLDLLLFPQIAKLAKNYLVVPSFCGTSAAVERMFSFTGHIFYKSI
jgi:hypothetical protein